MLFDEQKLLQEMKTNLVATIDAANHVKFFLFLNIFQLFPLLIIDFSFFFFILCSQDGANWNNFTRRFMWQIVLTKSVV